MTRVATEMNAMPNRVRLLPALVGLLVLAGALAVQNSGAAGPPPLTLSVNVNGLLEVDLGNGTRIRTSAAPGAVIPPGPYLAIVSSDLLDSQDVYHMFHLSGPGVSLSSELLPCENPAPINTVMLQPNSTYTYDDLRHPELTHVVFTTSSTGSSADTSGVSSGPSTAKSTGSVSNTSIVGSGVKGVAFRGTLTGTVNSVGMLTLRQGGKSVSSLESGRYKITVADTTAKGGFTIEGLHGPPVMLTGSSFVGKRTVTLDLTAGQWTFFSSTGTKHRFTVVA
jgi:hypothetical protein